MAPQAQRPRRLRLAQPRQGRRRHFDRRRRLGQAPVWRRQGRPRRHPRSAGDRHSADRPRRGDQDRPVRPGRPQGLPLHRALGDRDRHRRQRGPAPSPRPRNGPSPPPSLPRWPTSPARSCSGRPPSPPSRSRATAPTISPAPARRWRSPSARWSSTAWRSSTSPDRDHAVLETECGKGAYVRALARDLGRRLGCRGHVVALRRIGGRAVRRDERRHARHAHRRARGRRRPLARPLPLADRLRPRRPARGSRSPPATRPASNAASRCSSAAATRPFSPVPPTPPRPAGPSPSARSPRASSTPNGCSMLERPRDDKVLADSRFSLAIARPFRHIAPAFAPPACAGRGDRPRSRPCWTTSRPWPSIERGISNRKDIRCRLRPNASRR